MNIEFCARVNALCAIFPGSWESVDRTPTHNANIGGAPSSWHVRGEAVDLIYDSRELLLHAAREAIRQGFQGVEVDTINSHLHLDNRPDSWKVVYVLNTQTHRREQKNLTEYLITAIV